MRIIAFINDIIHNTTSYKNISTQWLLEAFKEKYGEQNLKEIPGFSMSIIKYRRQVNMLLIVQSKASTSKPLFYLKAKLLTSLYKADVVVNFTNHTLTTSFIPQIIVTGSYPYAEILLKEKKTFVIPLKNFKSLLVEKYNLTSDAINVINPVDNTAANKEIKEEQIGKVQDNNFFVTACSTEKEFMFMLKSFSLFKKWTRSDMHIMLVIPDNNLLLKAETLLKTYKYKSSVSIVQQLGEQINSSYAYIHNFQADDILNVLKIIQSETAVILTQTFEPLFSNAALYFENTEASLSQAMIQVYKNENLRSDTIQNAKKFVQQNTEANQPQKLLHIIEYAVNTG